METGYTVEQVMTRNVLKISQDTKIIDCAKAMAQKEVGSAIILEQDKVIGIITEQDLARKVMAKGLDPENTSVSEIMTKDPYTVDPDKDIYYAMVDMGKKKIKHLPVIRNGNLQGIVTFKDIIKIEPDLIDIVSFKSSLTKEQSESLMRSKG